MTTDVMGIAEIAERLGTTRDVVALMHHRGKLPAHDATVGGGRVKLWLTATIETWIREERQ